MKLCAIRSGSRGNAVLACTSRTRILIDCGISGRLAETGLRQAGVDPESLDAVLITHEHRDHIAGVGILSRRYHLPVYANEKTWAAMEQSLGKIAPENRRSFVHTDAFSLGDMDITPFSISHDAADPVGYTLLSGGKKMAVATDIGILEEELFRSLKGSDAVLLESNHDKNMLEMGSYPWPLKQRIRGSQGHLSNDDAGKAAEFLVKMGTRRIMLGHLSPENNYPRLAFQTVMNILQNAGIMPGRDMELFVAPGDSLSPVFEI